MVRAGRRVGGERTVREPGSAMGSSGPVRPGSAAQEAVSGSGCAAPAQQRRPASLERRWVGSAGFLWRLLLFRIPPEGSQGFQNRVTGS